jgi:hypothetical protein
VVVAAVGVDLARFAAGSSSSAADGWHGLDQWDQLRDVVAVAAGERDRQRNAAGVADQMVLGTRTPTVDRGRADVSPPLSART